MAQRSRTWTVATAPEAGGAGCSDGEKLRLYGLFKQATEGDCAPPAAGNGHGAAPAAGSRGSGAAWVGRAKHAAWAEHRGVPNERAMALYVAELDERWPAWREEE